ncbi:hypothetical protein [Mammaliicoccus sciuri]|uniref:hypothetical protein n=1 Tax=Mammaliicoccus sciuri TaxID=1296 RepID=UPI003F5788AC
MNKNEKVYVLIDPEYPENDERCKYYMNENELKVFAQDEIAFTDYPNTELKNINDVIEFLVIYDFIVDDITTYRDLENMKIPTNNVREWLEIYNKKIDTEQELEKAYDYFDNMFLDIDKQVMYDYYIENLLLYLHKGEFSIDDAIDVFLSRDLQEEEDISKLYNYLYITENNPENEEGFREIIAKNDKYYLSLIENDGPVYCY